MNTMHFLNWARGPTLRRLAAGMALWLGLTGGASASVVDFDTGTLVAGSYIEDGMLITPFGGSSLSLFDIDSGTGVDNALVISGLGFGGTTYYLTSALPFTLGLVDIIGFSGTVTFFNPTTLSSLVVSGTGPLDLSGLGTFGIAGLQLHVGSTTSLTINNLNFTAVPLPGAVWLLGSALVALVVISRKRDTEAFA